MKVKYNSPVERFSIKVSNFILRHFTSRQYSLFIDAAIQYGMSAAAENSRLNRPDPPHWNKDHRNISG